MPPEEFWRLVDKRGGPNACWPWLGRRSKRGYGGFGRKGKAHRLAYELGTGKRLKHHALHTCDNPPCCNPKHLYDGTDKDNVQDALERGRHRHGDGRHLNSLKALRSGGLANRSLSDVQVQQVRAAHGSHVEIARRFDVSTATISRVRSGKKYKEN